MMLSETITADGCRLHYLSEGEGRPVVFLHGGLLMAKTSEMSSILPQSRVSAG